MPFEIIDEFAVRPDTGRVYEHGWQSWSPTSDYPVTGTGTRATDERHQTMGYRPGHPAPGVGFQGEGLLAVDPGEGGPIRVYAAEDPRHVPSIRATYRSGELTVSADGRVSALTLAPPLTDALAAWAQRFALRAGVAGIRPAPTVWCSWYHYFTNITQADIVENLDAIGKHRLPVDVVQVDDGWQAGIGDWLEPSDRFPSLSDLVSRIHGTGRRAGIWVAPFLVGGRSGLATAHPEWLIPGAGANWGQPLAGLNLTHPGVIGYLREVFENLRRLGFDYYKIDFLYAGALNGPRPDGPRPDGPRPDGADPTEAYREGLRLIREAVGADAYLLGCGAPILPSVGLVDAMRVSPDVDPRYESRDGDLSTPSQRAAAMTTVARAWQHGRWWVNDPDCLIARPQVQRREDWARIVERYGGLRASSDRIADLDPWGLAVTRRLLSTVPPPVPFHLP